MLTTLGCFGSMIWLLSTPLYGQESKRLSLLFLSAILQGAFVGPLIKLAIDVDSRGSEAGTNGIKTRTVTCRNSMAKTEMYLQSNQTKTSKNLTTPSLSASSELTITSRHQHNCSQTKLSRKIHLNRF